MKILGVIPARYASSRLPGKPLADICGKPMIWWVYQQAIKVEEFTDVVVATDDERIEKVCKEYEINYIMTSKEHDTPTNRLYEVSKLIDSDYYVFIGGDEPLIDPKAIQTIVLAVEESREAVVHAMTTIKTAPEVIDFANIKVVVNTEGYLLYTTRSPLPFPKGRLDFEYKKFVGIGGFSKAALDFYQKTEKSKLEQIEECDLLRFLDKNIPVKMVDIDSRNLSVDTKKDLEYVIEVIKSRGGGAEVK